MLRARVATRIVILDMFMRGIGLKVYLLGREERNIVMEIFIREKLLMGRSLVRGHIDFVMGKFIKVDFT